MRAPIVLAMLLASSVARADKPVLAALAPAADAKKCVAIGPEGQVYEPDGKGAWVRTQAGGVAVELVGATAAGGVVIAAAKGAPPFKLHAGAWTAMNLGLKAKAIVGAGTRVLAAVGKSVFALDKAQPQKLADAPAPVTALAGGAGSVVAETDKGLVKLEGTAWKPIKQAPKNVRGLVSERWVLVDRGVFDLKVMKPIMWPAGVQIVDATTIGGDFVGVSMRGKQVELVTIKAGKVVREPVPVDDPKPVVGIAADKGGGCAIAMRDGRIVLRERGAKGAWTVAVVREELAPPKPGPAPAESK